MHVNDFLIHHCCVWGFNFYLCGVIDTEPMHGSFVGKLIDCACYTETNKYLSGMSYQWI